MAGAGALVAQPGFRRSFVILPANGCVTTAVEDDYHSMAVTLSHDGVMITAIDPVMDRAPWTTCPGAPAILVSTFVGAALADAAKLGFKQSNCTHLYDLTLLAAAHASDTADMRYDIIVSDTIDGLVCAEIHRDDRLVFRIEHRGDILTAPMELAGASLFKLRAWIDGLAGIEQEAARLLQWGTIIAHGRAYSIDRLSDASKMPPNCYTFQPDNKVLAKRVGVVFDFSQGDAEPLDHFGRDGFGIRQAAHEA